MGLDQTSQPEPLEIVYHDDVLVAINKPAGLLVHRSPIDKHETRFAIQLLRDQIGQRVYPCHRLDKPTSGVLLFALDQETQRHMSLQFENHQTGKTYLAVVRGHLHEAGTIDSPLKVMQEFRDRPVSENLQDAVTHYQPLKNYELPIPCGRYDSSRYTLLELRPETGRKHQLRRHLKHISHPIIGDTSHGNGGHNRLFREQLGSHRLLLHASKLCVTHPTDGTTLALSAPLPDEFRQTLSTLESKSVLPA